VINAAWHKKNRMPPRPTAEQRLRWHVEHAKVCGCRKLTPEMLKKLRFAVERQKALTSKER